ncbi:MAG: hypothetical protein QNJ36_16440 [Calothrix sp. MO_167.B42]|nr:hypothetical protein [Calothrix sp. MO_167.B42]
MSRHYPPASLRYLKARLWNLARPSFWGTAIFLAVAGMGLYEYWTNPDFWHKWQQKSVNSSKLEESSISDADKSVLADVDNLPVLLNDRAKANSPSTAPITIPKPQKGDNKTLLNDLTNISKKFPNKIKSEPGVANRNPGYNNLQVENPFLTQAENLLKGNNSLTQNNLLGVNSSSGNYLNPQVTPTPSLRVGLHGKTSPNIPTTSPLKAAINKSIQLQTNPVAAKSGNNFSVSNPLNQPGVNNPNNPGLQSPRINNLPGVTSVTSYNQPLQIKQQPNTSNLSPGYIQPGLTNQQRNQPTNILPNQQFNQGYNQPRAVINLNPTQQSSTVPIQSQLKQQQKIPTQPLPQVTSPSANYSRPAAANQGIPRPNNYDNTVWEQLIERSQYNRIQSQSSSNN